MQVLPITEVVEEIRSKLIESNTVILNAPPGAGKSTFLPLQLINEAWLKGKKILMLEPRRIAARTVAHRLASQLNEEPGETIGYRIRFENKTSTKTKLEILTEGILIRMLQHDNSLEDVGMIIFDEFHERSLNSDLAFALCREMQQILRKDIRILIMSATIDGAKLAAKLSDAPVITSKGRQFPVKFHHIAYDERTPLPQQMARLITKAFRENDGDLLAFFPGQGEILRTAELLEKESLPVKVVPLFGDLSMQKQMEAILPDVHGMRKIVLATSIAETSLTIEGIKIVVDCGFSRVPKYDPGSGLTKLQTIRVTKDAADQRAGRAGRLSAGVCYRLWTEGFDHHLIPHRSPEILEADLTSLVLEISNWGTTDINSLFWFDVPPRGALVLAEKLLNDLGALNGKKITAKGKELLRFPGHPRIANMILSSENKALACDLAALLDERDPLPKEAGADVSLRVEVLQKWRKKERVNADSKRLEQIDRAALNWRKIAGTKEGVSNISQCGNVLLAAFPERLAKKIDKNKYKLSNGKVAALHEFDELTNEELIAIASMDIGAKGDARIFLAAAVHMDDVSELAIERETCEWDEKKGELTAFVEWRIGDVVLDRKSIKNVPEEKRIQLLMEAIRKEGINVLNWNEEALELQHRIGCVRMWDSKTEWPVVSTEHLLNTLEIWLAPFLANCKNRTDLQKIDLHELLLNQMAWDQQQLLEKLVPQKILVPSGSMIKIKYDASGNAPVLAVRLQELFGMLQTPTVNQGKIKMMIHLLSPAYRPVQVTQDLESFWKNTYAEVRKDLRSRYPKHSWPDDPLTAVAVRGAKRRK